MKNLGYKISLVMALLLATSEGNAQRTALYFDGVNDQVIVSGTADLNSMSKMTFETWIYCSSKDWSSSPCNNCAPIVWNQNSNAPYRFGVGNSKQLYLSINDGKSTVTCTSTKTLSISTWQHIAATYDGAKIRLYIDGVCTDSTSTTITPSYGSKADVWIVDPQTGFGGILEETRIWNYARNAAEIRSGMKKLAASSSSGLLLQLHYEDGIAYKNNTSVSALVDDSPAKNSVKVSGFLLKDTVSNFVIGRSYCDTVAHGNFSVTRCKSYTLPSKKKTVINSGTYYDTILSWQGCDSAMVIKVTINPNSASSVSMGVCDSFVHPITKRVYYSGGKYVGTVPNWRGCDSLITYSVVLYRRDSSYLNYSGCENVQLNNGKWVSQSGTYIDTLSTWHGCDSFVFHTVNIRHGSTSSKTLNICNFVVCPSNKKVIYRSPGTYYDTVVNKSGCDSVITYTVVSAKTYSSMTLSHCGPYKAPSGKWLNNSGKYTDTLVGQNYKYCDSIISIDLTIKSPEQRKLNESACHFYLTPSGKTRVTQSANGIKDVILDQNGCDSIVFTIDLTIVNVNTTFARGTQYPANHNSFIAQTSAPGAQFQWMECSSGKLPITGETKAIFSPVSNGSYALQVTENGCTDTSACQTFAYNDMVNISHGVFVGSDPQSGRVVLRSTGANPGFVVKLFNPLGQVIQEFAWKEDLELAFDLPAATGMYLLEMRGTLGTRIYQVYRGN